VAKNEALNFLTRAKRDRHVFSEKLKLVVNEIIKWLILV
jgi:hypothetical protein